MLVKFTLQIASFIPKQAYQSILHHTHSRIQVLGTLSTHPQKTPGWKGQGVKAAGHERSLEVVWGDVGCGVQGLERRGG